MKYVHHPNLVPPEVCTERGGQVAACVCLSLPRPATSEAAAPGREAASLCAQAVSMFVAGAVQVGGEFVPFLPAHLCASPTVQERNR